MNLVSCDFPFLPCSTAVSYIIDMNSFIQEKIVPTATSCDVKLEKGDNESLSLISDRHGSRSFYVGR